MSLRMATLAGFLAETRRMVHWRSMQTLVIDTNGIVKKTRTAGLLSRASRRHHRGSQRARNATLVSKMDLDLAFAKQTVAIIPWMTGMLVGQGALLVAQIQYFQ